jgi:serine/threonine protein kinase
MNERDVFIAALQKDSLQQRQQYLDEACAGDDALRRNVEALLAAHGRAGDFLKEPVLGTFEGAADLNHAALAQLAASLDPGLDTPRAGETFGTETPALGFLAPPQRPDELGRLGHYRVLRLLGQGGMGLVFLADDTRLEREVALKVMRPELAADTEGRQRFLREARAAAHVHSDHVVTIYDVDQQDDVPYLVMELVRGRSLAEALEQGSRLPLGLCLKVARETAEGLAAAHAAGLIHRDVKPGNIWLEEPGGRAKLLDFGLARAFTGPLITQHNFILGTPAYMAPEQAAGQPLDARCDLFSLGAVLYHMLTGRRPFAGEDVLMVLWSLANVTPPPAVGLAPGLPAGVADFLDRLLAKDPAGRPASAAEVARALLALEPQAARFDPTATALLQTTGLASAGTRTKWLRRLALVGSGVLACLAIALIVTVLSGTFRGRSDDGRTAAHTITTSAPVPPPDSASRRQDDTPTPTGKVTPPPDVPAVKAFTLALHPYGQVQAVAFTGDSKTLVSADYSGEVVFWDVERHEKTFAMLAVPSGRLQSLAVDPQRRWLAVGHSGPDIRLFRFGESVAVGLLKGHTDRVEQLTFLKDGRTLLSAGFDGSIRRWDVETRQEGKQLRAAGPRLDCLAVWEDGQGGLRLGLAATTETGGLVSLDDVNLEHVTAIPDRVALSPDGTRLACTAGGNGNGVALWDVPGKTRLGFLPGAPFPRALAFTPDGKHVIATAVESTRIHETAGGKLVAQVDHAERAVYGSLAVSPDGRWLAVGTLKGAVRVWHLPSLLVPPG